MRSTATKSNRYTLYRDNYRVERLTVPSVGSALESLWLSVCSVTAVIIGVVYRPPSAPVAGTLDDLQTQLTHALATNKPLYVLGDVNFDWLRQDQSGVRRYTQMFDDIDVKGNVPPLLWETKLR